MSRVCVYIACSLDGFIAGADDDLSWLPGADGSTSDGEMDRDEGAVGFEEFMADVGALLMGRRTYDAVAGFGGDWPYGDRPVLVATHRPIDAAVDSVRAVSGDIGQLVAQARDAAQGKTVYLDGGNLIRQALDAGLIDELIVTFAPIILGQGHSLFTGVTKRHALTIVGHHRYGSMLQLHARPARKA